MIFKVGNRVRRTSKESNLRYFEIDHRNLELVYRKMGNTINFL